MQNVRRSLVVATATVLALSTGAVTATAASASEGMISVSILPDGTVELKADATLSAFGVAEELVFSNQAWQVRVEMRDEESSSGAGRPILTAGNSLAAGFCDVKDERGRSVITCEYEVPPQVRVDFGAVTGATTVVMAEGTTAPLAFNGGSGADYVQGASGGDWIRGNGGADFLYGGAGDDYLDGGADDDYVEGEAGRDDMRGGGGSNSLDAADNAADLRVDCGGLPKLLDYDQDLDQLTNCGANPTPIPPAPLEPVDPPAPGQGNGTVDGVPTTVDVGSTGGDNKAVTITAPSNNIFMNTGLWLGTPNTPSVPTFPPLSNVWSFTMPNLYPNSLLDLSIWSGPLIGPTSRVSATEMAPRAQPISTTGIRVNAQGVAEGDIPVPAGQQPGNFIVQVNAVTASGAAATINVGVVLTETTPDPNPGPDETIAISSATRGKGKKAATITVTGTTTGLAGTSITPRYRVEGAKAWTMGKPVTVADSGTFTWRLTTSKKVRIMIVSGAIKSKAVQVAAVRR